MPEWVLWTCMAPLQSSSAGTDSRLPLELPTTRPNTYSGRGPICCPVCRKYTVEFEVDSGMSQTIHTRRLGRPGSMVTLYQMSFERKVKVVTQTPRGSRPLKNFASVVFSASRQARALGSRCALVASRTVRLTCGKFRVECAPLNAGG